jgi:phage baseplate assembly protein W
VQDEFIGAGWAFPMGVSVSGGIALVRREQELEQAMGLILRTYPGERPMRPLFGCRLRDFVFRPCNELVAGELGQEVKNSLIKWEPRVFVHGVNVSPDNYDRTMLYIDIQYSVRPTNDRRNLVFPFYTIPADGSDY